MEPRIQVVAVAATVVLLAIFVGLARARPVVEPGDEAPVAAAHGI